MELVSCIIPVYNKQPYLKKCILSLMHQTYKNIEIITINDGSFDKSGKILDRLSKKDSRIKVIHKQNEGVSVARNEGLKIARGKYLCFLDLDDWLPKSSIEDLVFGIEKTAAICVMGLWKR